MKSHYFSPGGIASTDLHKWIQRDVGRFAPVEMTIRFMDATSRCLVEGSLVFFRSAALLLVVSWIPHVTGLAGSVK